MRGPGSGKTMSPVDIPKTKPLPQLLKVTEVARLLAVKPRTVQNWIDHDRIPYLRLPGGDYRIPLQGLLSSLEGTYDLAAALKEQNEAALAEPPSGEG
jgi:excisionase family DNA binding protein